MSNAVNSKQKHQWMNTPIKSAQGKALQKKYWLANATGDITHGLYTMVDRYDEFIQTKKKEIAKKPFVKNTWGRVLGATNWLSKTVLDYDFNNFVAIKKKRAGYILSPSAGFFFLTILPLTVGTRLIQAVKRRKEQSDHREINDILYRDLTAILVILYALEPIQQELAKVIQKTKDIRMLDEDGKMLLTKDVNHQYGLHSDNHLLALKNMKNNKASSIKKAFDKQVKVWENNTRTTNAFDKTDMAPIEQKLNELKGLMNEFFDKDATENTQKGLSKTIHEKIVALDEYVNENFIKNLNPREQKRMKRLFPEMKHFFSKYVNNKRLPISVGGFLFTAGIIGAIPVLWNKYRADQEMAELHKAEAELDAQLAQKAKNPGEKAITPTAVQAINAPKPKELQQAMAQLREKQRPQQSGSLFNQNPSASLVTGHTQTAKPVSNPFFNLPKPQVYHLNKAQNQFTP